MELARDVGIQVIIIFILMAIGFILTKSGNLSEKGIKEITNIVLSLVTPCVLINSYQQKVFNSSLAIDLLYAALFSFAVQIVAVIIGMIIFRKDKKEHYRINIFSTAYSNCGFMAIPPICQNSTDNHKFFQKMYNLAVDIMRKKYDNICVNILSMGMSDDFADAIACGSTMIRVGTAIFGARNYAKDSSN